MDLEMTTRVGTYSLTLIAQSGTGKVDLILQPWNKLNSEHSDFTLGLNQYQIFLLYNFTKTKLKLVLVQQGYHMSEMEEDQ
jgi:hypothetical protein